MKEEEDNKDAGKEKEKGKNMEEWDRRGKADKKKGEWRQEEQKEEQKRKKNIRRIIRRSKEGIRKKKRKKDDK